MRAKKLIVAALLALGLLGGQALSVGAWNGNTAASPDTYRCTQINTTPGNLAARFGGPFVTCTSRRVTHVG